MSTATLSEASPYAFDRIESLEFHGSRKSRLWVRTNIRLVSFDRLMETPSASPELIEDMFAAYAAEQLNEVGFQR